MPDSSVHIGLVVATLAMGGTERAVTTLANYWSGRGNRVTVYTLSSASADFYRLDGAVERQVLGLGAASSGPVHAAWGNLRRAWRLRRALGRTRPDVVISFLTDVNVVTLLATRGLSIPVLVAERTDPRRHLLPSAWVRLRRLVYPWAERVIVQTRSIAEWAMTIVPPDRVVVIANAVTPRGMDSPCRTEASDSGTVAAMGRLTWAKGFDVLVRAFAQSARQRPGWTLALIGDGEERNRLEALARELGVQERIRMAGRVSLPEVALAGASIFVLSSRYEGFPNALLEAMACGIPAIATQYAPGSDHVVRDGVDGIVVPVDDVDAMAAALDRLMGDEGLRDRFAKRASEVADRFGFEKIMSEWDRTIASSVRRAVA